MKAVDKLYYEEAEKHIPNGLYCYDDDHICPFWDKDITKPSQANGYCHYLLHADWEQNYTSLLWDMCKECTVNVTTEFE